jgi:hypothetical protein
MKQERSASRTFLPDKLKMSLRILVGCKRAIDYAVKIRVTILLTLIIFRFALMVKE